MGMAQNYGFYFSLETPEQRARAEILVQENPRKFEIAGNRFYHYTRGEETIGTLNWIQEGIGKKPSAFLPEKI
jgi:hypothetical protein